MKDAGGHWIGYGLGDVDPKVTAIKDFMRHKFASYCNGLDESPLYDAVLQTAVATMQSRYGLPVTGVLNAASQEKMGFIKKGPTGPALRPMYFSVEGHMSDWRFGPVADTGTDLENEGRVHHQPIRYNSGALPFDNDSGSKELARLVYATHMDNGNPFPAGTPWVLGGFSQGMIVVTDFIVNYLAPGKPLNYRLKDLKGVLAYGNPCRTQGSVAPWAIAESGPSANAGMDPKVRLDLLKLTDLVQVMDVYRKGDIFSDNEQTAEGAIKSAIYEAIARGMIFSFDPISIVGQIAAAFGKPFDYVMGAFQAIISGISFLAAGANNPHYSPFNIEGGKNWVRSLV